MKVMCCSNLQVGLLIIDEIHLLGADRGPVLEVIVSRMRWAGVVKQYCSFSSLITLVLSAENVSFQP